MCTAGSYHTQYRDNLDGSIQHLAVSIMMHQHYDRRRNHCRSITADCVGAGSDYLSLLGGKSRIQKISGKLITWQWWHLSLPGESTIPCSGSSYEMAVIVTISLSAHSTTWQWYISLSGQATTRQWHFVYHYQFSCSCSSIFFSAIGST